MKQIRFLLPGALVLCALAIPGLLFGAANSLPDGTLGYPPQWGQITFPPAGGSYTDTVSGLPVWRITDDSTPQAGMWKHYSPQATHISRTVDGARYFLLYEDVATGEPWMAEYNRGAGASNHQTMASLFSSSDRAQFSRRYGYGLYYLTDSAELIRYDVNKMEPGDWIPFPKEFRRDARLWGAFGTTFGARDLQVSINDELFAFRVEQSGSPRGVIAWNSTDNSVCSYQGSVDRYFLFENGQHLLAFLTSGNSIVMDLSTCQTNASNLGVTPAEHEISAGIDYALVRDDSTHTIYRYNPASRSRTAVTDAGGNTNGPISLSGRWITTQEGAPQWFVMSGWDRVGDRVEMTYFQRLYNEVYYTYQLAFDWAEDKVTQAVHGVIGSGQWLAEAPDWRYMQPGTFYWDGPSRILYVFRYGGGDPSNSIQGYDPRAGWQAITYVRDDWSDVRFLVHHHSRERANGNEPRAVTAPDGSLVMWTSDMYSSGRYDVFVVEPPVSPVLAEPFPYPQVDLKVNAEDGPLSVMCGDTLDMSWTVGLNPVTCYASGGSGNEGWGGTKTCASGAETTQPVYPAGAYTYMLHGDNEYGTGEDGVDVDVLADPPVVDLKVDGSDAGITIVNGATVTLTWNVTGLTPLTCTASGDWAGTKSCAGGSETIGPLTAAGVYTYTLTASDRCGLDNDTVTVSVLSPPAVDLKVNGLDGSVTIRSGDSATLSWSTANNPTSCSASGDWSGYKSCAGGTEVVGPFSGGATQNFSLMVSNGYVSDTDSVSLSILSAAGAADINSDGCVNIVDLGIILSNWLGTDAASDINGSGRVDIVDLGIVLSNWLNGCP